MDRQLRRRDRYLRMVEVDHFGEPVRPKGMHRRTFARLEAEAAKAWCNALLGHFSRSAEDLVEGFPGPGFEG